ncbi:hypothetical protein [Sharpea azabuensis]|uniref:hypothetical protein n=1 Tax=Sharpea azabuensis TaxID=322505 RepID=UPI002409C753|nr:hypothetical protein [Sharpea azabuensis]MDD6513278.1 hypothetical protein [Sharpea azabuensis]
MMVKGTVVYILMMLYLFFVHVPHQVDFVYIITSNHFIALFLNNTILIICFYEIRKLKQIYYPLCVRLKKHTNLYIHTRITSYALLMLGIQYIFVAALFGLHHTPWHLLFAHTILLLLCVNIIGLQFQHKSNLLYIFLPISLNLIEHYLIFN